MQQLLFDNFGVVSRAQLLAAGVSPVEVQRLVRSGTLSAIRRGWYACSVADPLVQRAVRLGGALTCVSALRLHGLWAPRNWPDRCVHIRRTRYRNGWEPPPGVTACGIPGNVDAPVKRAVDALPTALACAFGCLAPHDAIALADSAVNKGLIRTSALNHLMSQLPWRASRLADRIDAGAQSGTESLVRQRLRAKGVQLRSQVQIGGVGRVDFLIGDRLVIEVDSWTYHADPAAFRKDRQRDRRLVAQGYLVIRLTYEEVMFQWEQVEADLLTVIRERRHRWPRPRG